MVFQGIEQANEAAAKRQSNAPILLITTMALWQHAGYGWPVAELTHC